MPWNAYGYDKYILQITVMYILSVSLSVCLMCVNVSVGQLALIHSPPLSEIFVFTDASPKDHHLQSAVQALILAKQTKVNHKKKLCLKHSTIRVLCW